MTIPTSGGSPSTPTRFPSRSTEPFVLTLWTDDPLVARRADDAGIDRVGVDLEHLGKRERQRGLGTWLSTHREADLAAIGAELRQAALFARVNPLNAESAREIEAVLGLGARVLMLPMVVDPRTVERFVELIRGRATVVLLIEHVAAIERLRELVAVDGVDEIHVGLNDLALSLGLPNRWLVLGYDFVLEAAATARAAGVRFGLGGIGRVGDVDLPVPADLVYAQYARTGATAALLSRSFFKAGLDELPEEVARARAALAEWRSRPAEEVAAAHEELVRRAQNAAEW